MYTYKFNDFILYYIGFNQKIPTHSVKLPIPPYNKDGDGYTFVKEVRYGAIYYLFSTFTFNTKIQTHC